jgi:hypothetical protein
MAYRHAIDDGGRGSGCIQTSGLSIHRGPLHGTVGGAPGALTHVKICTRRVDFYPNADLANGEPAFRVVDTVPAYDFWKRLESEGMDLGAYRMPSNLWSWTPDERSTGRHDDSRELSLESVPKSGFGRMMCIFDVLITDIWQLFRKISDIVTDASYAFEAACLRCVCTIPGRGLGMMHAVRASPRWQRECFFAMSVFAVYERCIMNAI